ncbi:prolipoprotein diacylglyceryl transferase [Vulcaniibacterium gelatinicum]|uniref:prolipoprotein diacylglyceryl transferase n=1 Tax=Vulcaniibacterium gelatinicum TaxID=2598725 RepID=UPI0011C751F1|nr:prolipoprotein diacylglyceryl transferase [Vulcaniibacterium gelatinicum]
MTVLHQIDPVALSLGPLKVHWYGLMYLLGFVAAWLLGRSRVRAGRLPGVDEHGFSDLMFYAMLGVVLGGRIGYVLFYAFSEFLADPLMLVRVWEGGMSFHGGLLGVLAAVWWWSRRHRLHFMDTAEFIAPLVPPGLGFGRIGNYIGGELWGKPTGGDWGVVFPRALPPEYAGLDPATLRAQFEAGALDAFARHPSQLYQATLEGLVLFAVLWWFSRRPRPRHAVGGLFALLYGCFRFAVEFVREPDAQIGYLAFDWLTMGQVLSLPLIALGLAWLWLSRRAPTLQPQPPAPSADAAAPSRKPAP